MGILAKNQYCCCRICSELRLNYKLLYNDDIQRAMEYIAEVHPDAFRNALNRALKNQENPHAKEIQAMRIGHQLRVKPSHTVDKDGNLIVHFEVKIPAYIAQNYGCDMDQIRKDIKKHGGENLANHINQLSFAETPESKKEGTDEDRLY